MRAFWFVLLLVLIMRIALMVRCVPELTLFLLLVFALAPILKKG